MLYRKSEFKKHKYFLKSIHGLWILPIVIINLIVPLFNFFIYKLNNNDMVIDIEKIIFFIDFCITFIFSYLYARLQLNIRGYEDRNFDIRRRLSRNKRHYQRSL